MAESMDMDTPIPSPASAVPPRNAMAALMANAKGKGKEIAPTAADQKAVDGKEGLPWYVLFPFFCVPRFRDVDVYWSDDRVEKYRPVSLDDVVSHKDITGTSMSFGHVSWLTITCNFLRVCR